MVRSLTMLSGLNASTAVVRPFVRSGLVALAVTGTSSAAAAPAAVCDTVKLGDTASAVAQRLTGSRESIEQPWIRIIDPASSRVIPKVAYDRILAGWQVCVPAARVGHLQQSRLSPNGTNSRPDATNLPSDGSESAQPPTDAAPTEAHGTLRLALVLLGPAVFGAAVGFA